MTIQPCSAVRHIGEKAFSKEDQQLFASVSLDRNPMHMDSIAARRLMTGHQVVHGIHILITAIEYWQNDNNSYPIAISCSFDNPVSVGDQVIFTQNSREENDFTIEATVNGLLCSQIIITTARKSGYKANQVQIQLTPNQAKRAVLLMTLVSLWTKHRHFISLKNILSTLTMRTFPINSHSHTVILGKNALQPFPPFLTLLE